MRLEFTIFQENSVRRKVYYISNYDQHELIANIVSTKSARFDTVLRIKNIGYKGQLPEITFIPKEDLKDVEP